MGGSCGELYQDVAKTGRHISIMSVRGKYKLEDEKEGPPILGEASWGYMRPCCKEASNSKSEGFLESLRGF